MAGERKVTTTEAGEKLILELNQIAVHCDDAISSMQKLGYSFPDMESANADEIEGNELIKLVRECQNKIDNAVSLYKVRFSEYMIAKEFPPKQPE